MINNACHIYMMPTSCRCDRKQNLCVLSFDQATRQPTCLGTKLGNPFQFHCNTLEFPLPNVPVLLSLKDAVHDVLQELPDLEAQELTIRESQSLQR